MSGVFGIVNLDRRPVDRGLLERATEALRHRGPDGRGIWVDGHVGFGHTLLRTALDAKDQHQPCTLDGKVWITGDMRIDARAELLQELRGQDCDIEANAPDAKLVLHAYRAWGARCLEKILGDFCFAIWDAPQSRLLLARDPFGVRPLYYACSSHTVLFANDLAVLRRLVPSGVSLNEQFIGDFLIFGYNHDERTTVFREVSRLPPGHFLLCEERPQEPCRYWSPPAGEEIRYKRQNEYQEHLREVLEQAVADRIRGLPNAAILLSGGMDSGAVAALASRTMGKLAGAGALQAFAVTATRLLPEDREGLYTAVTARSLGLPIRYLPIDEYRLYEPETSFSGAEPWHSPFPAVSEDLAQMIARAGTRVALTGTGGDVFGAGSGSHYVDLLRHGRYRRFLVDAIGHLHTHGSLRGMGLRGGLKRLVGVRRWQPEYPSWLDPRFARRNQLRERWEEINRRFYTLGPQPPGTTLTHFLLRHPQWSTSFEADAELPVPLLHHHPFFDLRVVRYYLGIPVYLTLNKTILRRAMRGLLPELICARPKAIIRSDPIRARLSRAADPDPLPLPLTHVGGRYVDAGVFHRAVETYRRGDHGSTPAGGYALTAPISLDLWLRNGWKESRDDWGQAA